MIYTDEDLRDMAISKVCHAKSEDRRRVIYEYARYLSDVDFVFADENKGTDYISPIINMFALERGEICSAFYSNRLSVLNLDLLTGKKDGFYLNFDIGLDTQIVSYIERYINGTLNDVNVGIIKPLQINRPIPSDINIDAYVSENCIISKEVNSIQMRSIWSTFYFLNLPCMSEQAAKINADEATDNIVKFIQKARMANVYKERYHYTYCMLLKIVLLHFEKTTIKEKLSELLHFENEITCTSDVTFINIGIAFWEQGAKLIFFGRCKRGKKTF